MWCAGPCSVLSARDVERCVAGCGLGTYVARAKYVLFASPLEQALGPQRGWELPEAIAQRIKGALLRLLHSPHAPAPLFILRACLVVYTRIIHRIQLPTFSSCRSCLGTERAACVCSRGVA